MAEVDLDLDALENLARVEILPSHLMALIERVRALEAETLRLEDRLGGYGLAASECELLRARVQELEKECFALAANQCHGGYGDERGHHRCKENDRLRGALAESATSLETIAGSAGHPESALDTMSNIRGYANSRATVARAACHPAA